MLCFGQRGPAFMACVVQGSSLSQPPARRRRVFAPLERRGVGASSNWGRALPHSARHSDHRPGKHPTQADPRLVLILGNSF